MKKACSCLFMIVGSFVGLIGGLLIMAILDEIGFGTDIGGLAIIASIVFFIWVGSKTGNYIGDKIENRKSTRSNPLGKRAELQYINASGEHRSVYVDSASAFRDHNKVKVNLWNSGGTIELVIERIKNPEVLGLPRNPQKKDKIVSRDCPSCSNGIVRSWQGEMRCWNCGHVLKAIKPDTLPPVLPSGEFVLLEYWENTGTRKLAVKPEACWTEKNKVRCVRADTGNIIILDLERIINPEDLKILNPNFPIEMPEDEEEPVVVLLQYLNRHGQEREIRVESKAYTDGNSMIHCYLADSNGTLVLKREQILNSSVLILKDISEMPTEEEEPPVLEPKVLELGDSSGPELIYTQNSGELAVIYFDPTTVEQVGNLVNLSPMGINERYAIALGKIINPDVLENEPEPELEVEELPPVLPKPEPQPEVLEPQLPQGTRVLIRRVPTDSYEAVQVMRRIKPKLSTFDIFELLEQERLTALTGYDHDEAIRVGGELEAVGCSVDIMREGN